MYRYRICFEYLGTNFSGSQKQPDTRTVQGEIEKALCTLTKKSVNTIFSGRTDAGVSARNQSAHFEIDFKMEKNKFLNSMNGLLPKDIRVFDVIEVPNSFHAQKSAKFRHYRYTIRNAKQKSVFDLCTAFVKYPLDEARMKEALKYLEGEHDFSAFKSKSDNPAKICELYYTNAKRSRDGNYIVIDIIGNRFLYNMVRTIVGTLLLIEKDGLNPLYMAEILKSGVRSKAGSVAEASGLVLEYVGYDDCFEYINKMKGK